MELEYLMEPAPEPPTKFGNDYKSQITEEQEVEAILLGDLIKEETLIYLEIHREAEAETEEGEICPTS